MKGKIPQARKATAKPSPGELREPFRWFLFQDNYDFRIVLFKVDDAKGPLEIRLGFQKELVECHAIPYMKMDTVVQLH